MTRNPTFNGLTTAALYKVLDEVAVKDDEKSQALTAEIRAELDARYEELRALVQG